MGRKRKYTSDVMINTVHQILDGSTSISLAANQLDVHDSTAENGYNKSGIDFFTERPRNNTVFKINMITKELHLPIILPIHKYIIG